MAARVPANEDGLPERIQNWLYYVRTEEGGNGFPIYCRRPLGSDETREEIVLDQNSLARNKPYLSVPQCKFSLCHSMLAFTADTTGAERYNGYIKDLRTGRIVDEIEGVVSLEWGGDARTLFYTVPDPLRRPHRVYRRRVGDPPGADELLQEERDPAFFLDVTRTKDGRYVLLNANSKTASEVSFLDVSPAAAGGGGPGGGGRPRLIARRRAGLEYFVEHSGPAPAGPGAAAGPGRLLIVTNAGGAAPDYKLVCADPARPEEAAWADVYTPPPGTKLEDVDVFAGRVVAYERRAAGQALRILTLRHRGGGLEVAESREVDLGPQRAGAAIRPGANCDFAGSTARLAVSSPVSPWRYYDADLATGRLTPLRHDPGFPGLDLSRYACEQRWARSHDGAEVPMTVVWRKDRCPHPATPGPALLTCYGAYGQCVDSDWQPARFSLLDRGWVLALCHVRGGGELGNTWHQAGRQLSKANSFHDAAACAHALVAQGLARPGQLAIQGASAGGLVVGACINMFPGLFRAAIAKVPFVDPVNTMLDPSLPLTQHEYDEWGDVRRPEVLAYVRSYSPYDNVPGPATGADAGGGGRVWPWVYVTGAYEDTRVGYWEPAKWVARLRAAGAGSGGPEGGLVLLETSFDSGHFGAGGRAGPLREAAREAAFLHLALGLPLR